MDIINTNLVTSFNVLKPSVKAMMKSGGGSIVLCSSAVARHGLVNHEAIAAAKVRIIPAEALEMLKGSSESAESSSGEQ